MDEEFDTSSDVSSDIDTDVSDVEFDETDMSDVSDDIPEDDYSNDEEFTDDTDGDYEEDTDSFDEDVGVDNYDFTEDDVETEDIAEDSISEIEEDSGTEKFDDELSDVDDDIEEDTEDFDETEDMESSEEIDEIEEDTEEFQETDEETDCADEVIEEDVEDVTEDTATEIEEDTVEDTTVDSEENMAEDTTAETEEDVVEETATDTEEGEAEDTTSETEEGATEDTATKTEKDVVEDTATETEEGVAEDTTTEMEEGVLEDTTTEMEEGVAEETTTDTEEGTAEETATEMKENIGEVATTEIGEDVAEDTMDETVEGTAVDTGTETADRTSFEKLSEYMNEHNYGPDDFETYSQDPVWRELHGAAYPEIETPNQLDNERDNTTSGKNIDIESDVIEGNADRNESLFSKLFGRKDVGSDVSPTNIILNTDSNSVANNSEKDLIDDSSKFVRDMVGADEYAQYQNFYNRLGKLDISDDYRSSLINNYKNMDSDIKDFYNVNASELKCLDSKFPGTAHFSSNECGFKFNETKDVAKGLGTGNTFYHESAHMLDWLSGKYGNNLTERFNLTASIQEDYNDAISGIMNKENCTLEQAQNKLSDILWSHPTESNCVSDVFGGLTGNRVSGPWGHSFEYWAQRDRSIIGKEAFAEITADSACNHQNLAFTKQYLPKTYELYKKIIKGVKTNG